MNNNRGNNRRRGRGNNNRQQGGGQQLNRIDSRARGNAPQLLEKYRKMAHDAHLNGDRVTEEYYLQFADHYFRVIADQRARQEEQRQPRHDRWQEGGDNGGSDRGERFDNDASNEYGSDSDYPASPYSYGEPRRDYNDRQQRDEAPPAPAPAVAPPPAPAEAAEEEPAAAAANPYEPVENPFTRDNRGPRGLKPRRPRREAAPANEDDARSDDAAPAQLDLAVLPPSIAPREEPAVEAEAKPKRRTTRRKPPADDAGEPLRAAE